MSLVAVFNRIWIFTFFSIVTIILICDLSFYSYFQDHINVLFFGLFEDDTKAVLTTIWKNYNVPLWGGLIFLIYFLFWKLLKKIFTFERIDLNYMRPWDTKKLAVVFVGLLVVLAFFMRGNFTRLPLSIEDSRIGAVPSINHLSLNGVIALNRAIKIRSIYGKDDIHYLRKNGYKKISEALYDLGIHGDDLNSIGRVTATDAVLTANPPHVMMVVVESLGAYWWNFQSPDFNFLSSFEKHIKEDTFVLNLMPSDNGTIGSITSIISGLPLRPGSRVLSEGRYMKTSLPSAFHRPYLQSGYETNFIYGGKLGWRQLGDYLLGQKYDHVVGADEIKTYLQLDKTLSPSDIGNEWGIFDEYLFKYINERLKNAQKPQFFMVLTTTNHPPFEVPSHYVPLPLKLSAEQLNLFSKPADEVLQRFKTLQYTNHVIGEFLTEVKNSPLKDKVVFAVTGDHSFWISKKVENSESVLRYRVPFYLYVPTPLKKYSFPNHLVGSHIDMAPTLYELTLSNAYYWSLGRPLFKHHSVGINGAGGLTINQEAVVFEDKSYCYDYNQFPLTDICDESQSHQKIKQYRKALMSVTDEFLRSQVR